MTSAAAFVILFGLVLLNHVSTLLLDEDCGVARQYEDRIMNGETAAILANPWMTLIKTPTEFVCGGTLINHQFVLTAAHCLYTSDTFTKKHTYLIARLGEHNRSTEHESLGPHEDFNVVRTYERKGFEMTSHVNDIALLKLQRSVIYNLQIRPICIQLDNRSKSNSDAIQSFTVVGWGKTESKNTSDVLKTAQVYRMDKSVCTSLTWVNLTDSQICAGTGNKVDTCNGDSGGPLYTNILDGGPGRQTQFGIVSYGTLQCFGAGVYTDIMSHVDYIERVVMESDITVLLPKIDLLDEGCLDDPKLRSRSKSGADTFPWLAQVFMDSFLISYGALISNSTYLHLCSRLKGFITLKVTLGEVSESISDAYKVSSTHLHPEFESQSLKNDVALLELEKKLDYTDFIKPICLPSLTNKLEKEKFQKNANFAEKLTAVGWGIVGRRSTMVQRVNSSKCYQGQFQPIEESQICMEHPKSNMINVGGGSPLVKRLPYGNSRAFTLVGLASFGRMENHSPDVYTNVLSYMDWIGLVAK
ncbi:hypothetical protein KR084_008694 [Drosophila pseudotakahashii]|nr:hypothetical protein KR084_008694 [Drosophila pseudotakahashii]